MDPAIIGKMRIGHFRIGVKKPEFDRAVARLEKTSTPTKFLADKSTVLADETVMRADVYIPAFDRLIARIEKV